MKKEADICLLLEGSYPYVRGGVSSWVHQIISGLPEFSFYILFLGGDSNTYNQLAYEFPDNVVGFEVHYLYSKNSHLEPKAIQGKNNLFRIFGQFLAYFAKNSEPIPSDLLNAVLTFMGKNNQLSLSDFLYSEASWALLIDHYMAVAKHQSFVDFFWTYRNIHQPLFILSQIAQNMPNAKVFHSISTGYAGFLGALCRESSNKPYLLTEHGIYTKERKIDLAQAAWINDQHELIDISMHRGINVTRNTWIRFFEQLGLSAYHHANKIISLFEGNRKKQHKDGAPSTRTQVIVNGINTRRFDKAYQRRPNSPPMVVGLVGRVVPIKDIKTFIRTIRGVLEVLPDVEGWVIGPTEEDEDYVHECKLLIKSLGLENNVKLLGNQNVVEIMPQLGIMMLTSISESQPLVLLEAMAAGIPCIATEVGACREMIHGALGADAELGSCGEIIPIASPIHGAKVIVDMLSHDEKWRQTGDIGKSRVVRYYDETLMFDSYRTLYLEAIHGRNRV